MSASVYVVVRPCIYDEDGHSGPCVGPDGQWWCEVPVEPESADVLYTHIGRLL